MFLFFLISCTKTITFQVTTPAQISIRPDIKKIAPVDREYTDDSKVVIQSMMAEIVDARNPRFVMVDAVKSHRAYQQARALQGQPLTKDQSQKICKETEVDGIVSLERYRLDRDWDYSTFKDTVEERRTITENGEDREQVVTKEVTKHRAKFDVNMTVDWKFYSCDGNIEDQISKSLSNSWQGVGMSRSDAKIAVGETDQRLIDMQKRHGATQMRRISPYEINVTRSYHTCGPKKLKEGNKALQDGNYAQAKKLYKLAAEDSVKKDKGKSLFNYAVSLELLGQTKEALKEARQANHFLQNNLSQEYVDILRKRVEKERKLDSQLK